MQRYIFLMFLILLLGEGAEGQQLWLRGRVLNKAGAGLPGVTIEVGGSAIRAMSDQRGYFALSLAPNRYRLRFRHLNYQVVDQVYDLVEDSGNVVVTLSRRRKREIAAVGVTATVGVRKVKESAYNVTVVDAKPTYNTSTELSGLLNKASGVRIRQETGLGSDYNISINGFTGRSVKVFMDGVPMEGFGSAYNLNNIPTTLVERLEIYKGVVPIAFGGDAMGGVINIVTRKVNHSYLDASYSYGSFNTHKSNINAGYVTPKGLTVDLRLIQNYSDNRYRVYAKNLDLSTETFSEDRAWYRRFNDSYHNESLVGRLGYVNVPWADQFFVGATIGKEYKEVQHAYDQKIVYGQRHNSGSTIMPNLTYLKRRLLGIPLDVRINANYNSNKNRNVDTASRRYNWEGAYRDTRLVGEGRPALADFRNENGSVTSNVLYQLGKRHDFMVNHTFMSYQRKRQDRYETEVEVLARDAIRTKTNKAILGMSYQYKAPKNWNMSIFYKRYMQYVRGGVDTSTVSSKVAVVEQSRRQTHTGYGAMGTYVWGSFQVKASYERAFRLLSGRELFGDETLETANTKLRPEQSRNGNVNISYGHSWNKKHDFFVEAGFIYRNTFDYIRRVVEARYGSISSVNHGKVLSVGVDGEAKYSYQDQLNISLTGTYLRTKNLQKYMHANSTQVSNYYGDQLPNVPYIYGNADVQYTFKHVLGRPHRLIVGYTMNYIHEFYLGWPSLGSSKLTLPTQLSHDLFVTASLARGKYNVTLETRNINDELLYDNFELQKPGRSIQVKLRYFINKSYH